MFLCPSNVSSFAVYKYRYFNLLFLKEAKNKTIAFHVKWNYLQFRRYLNLKKKKYIRYIDRIQITYLVIIIQFILFSY